MGLEQAARTLPDPETLPRPKETLNDLKGRRATGADLERIASAVDLSRVESRCPKGFGRFASEVRHQLLEKVIQRKTEKSE